MIFIIAFTDAGEEIDYMLFKDLRSILSPVDFVNCFEVYGDDSLVSLYHGRIGQIPDDLLLRSVRILLPDHDSLYCLAVVLE